MKSVKVPAWEFYGWQPETLTFPEDWEVHEQRMKGHDTPALKPKPIKEKIQHPIGTESLSTLARGKRRCVIIFDDMTRPTKTTQMLPAVLDELHKGGMSDEQIVFMMASGAHTGRMLFDFQKKLGEEVCEKYLVFNHNPYDSFVDLGKTSRGTPILINKEVMSCDLKVVVSSIMPHFGYGFGGGSKMILPGVAAVESISPNHAIRKGTDPGKVSGNERRLDSEEAAEKVGLDFVVHSLLNADSDVCDLVAGDMIDAHREGVRRARNHYVTKVVPDADVAIGNTYPMANEGYKAYHIILESVRKGGDLVYLLYTPEGCRVHFYNGRFGTDYGGEGWRPDVYTKKPWKMGRVLCVSPTGLMKADEHYYGEGSKWVKTWKETLKLLEEAHGSSAKVAIYPTASMQISESNAAHD
ncbi:MAG: lactate racemase domain-containing protein [Candidatus Bathyarchaeota archaeon]|nr:lactate racemase domain-containing protein [Candidatus Bathyarchaeota archaeon]